MKKIIIILLAVLSFQNLLARDIIVKYFINAPGLTDPMIYLNLSAATNRNDHLSGSYTNSRNLKERALTVIYKDSVSAIIVAHYAVEKEGCYFFTNLAGQEILLDPANKDTIVIKADRARGLKCFSPALNDSIMLPWLLNLSVDKKHSYVLFFDSLAHLYGDINLRMVYSIKSYNHKLNDYLAFAEKVYKERLAFLGDFAAKNNFPEKLRYYAQKEIQDCFYDDLLEPIVYFRNSASYPQKYLDSLNNIGRNMNDEELFASTSLYKKILSDYVLNYRIIRSENYWDSTHLSDSYHLCEHRLSGKIREYMLTVLMEQYIVMDRKEYLDAYYHDYQKNNTSSPFSGYIDSLYELHLPGVMAQRMSDGDSLLLHFGNPLQMHFEDRKHNDIQLKSVADRKLIVVDFWATWCLPCRMQKPYLDTLVAEFKDSVRFIAISGDEQKIKWDSWVATDSTVNPDILQLYAPAAFTHPFFRGLSITRIPRFVLLSADGKVLMATMPTPSIRMNKFREVLHTSLKSTL